MTTSTLRKIKYPNAGIFNADNSLNKAGHHYLEQLQLVPAAVADIQDQISAVGTIGALAGLNTLDRAHLATGFGLIEIANVELDASTAIGTFTTTVPIDDTIPQSTEGDQALAGSYMVISGTSQLRVRFEGVVGTDAGGTREVVVALYQDAGADAIGAVFIELAASFFAPVSFEAWVPSPGAGVSTTFAVRIGPNAGTAYLNGTSGSRYLGGAIRSSLRLSEFEAR